MEREVIEKLHELEKKRDKWKQFAYGIVNYGNLAILKDYQTSSVYNSIWEGVDEEYHEFIEKVLKIVKENIAHYEALIDKL